MAMEYTTVAEVFVPQALGGIVETYLYKNLALMSSGMVADISGEVTWNQGGNTVTFPTYIGFTPGSGSEELPLTGASIESKQVTMGYDTAPVINRIVPMAFTGTMFEDVVANANIASKVIDQISSEAALDVDLALITEAETTDLVYDDEQELPISYDQVVNAKMLWGDKAASMDSIIVVHSAVYKDLIKLSDVRQYNNWGPDPTVKTGAVPYFAGMPVYMSDNLTNSAGVYNALIVARGGMEFAWKRNVTVEMKKTPGNDNTYLDATYRYLVHLSARKPTRTIVLKTGVTG